MRIIKNLDKLQVERDYKYKELCALFEEEEKTHHSKEAQLKDWACFFRWSHPTKQKYHIKEIYEEPRQRIDGRTHNGGNNTSKYLALDDIIMEYVDDGKEAAYTLPRFAVEFGILTEQYGLHKNNIKKFCKENNYSFEIVSALFGKIQETVLGNIETSFERLNADGFLEVRSFMVLRLVGGKKVELSGKDALRVVALENEVCKQMGISRPDAYRDEYSSDYKKKVNLKIFEVFGYDTQFHYKLYKIKKSRDGYKQKSNDDRWKLSRKFVVTIGLYLLRFVCTYSSENIITDPKTGEDFIVNYEKEESSSDIIKHIIDLINYFFVYMNSASWDAYWNDGELELRNEEKALRFWSQYCLLKLVTDTKKTDGTNQREQPKTEKSKRDIAIAELGEDAVLEFEYILTDLDWERCFIDEVYTERCGKALESYYDIKGALCYAKDQYIEEFCLYFSRMTREGKEAEIIPFYEFVEQFE